MKNFQIENRCSGVILGIHEAENATDALDVMARDAGCADYAAACEITQSGGDELVVREVAKTITYAGITYDADAVARLMDDEIRERLHDDQHWDSEQAFFDAYVDAHAKEFGYVFVIN